MLIEHNFGQPPSVTTAELWQDGFGLTYDVVYDAPQTFAADWNPANNVPMTYVIDRDGVIVLKKFGSSFSPIETAVINAL